jgi:nitrous oxidase accessory protein NosD
MYALSVSQLNPASTSKAAIEAAMAGKIVSQAELMGIYNRPPSRVVVCGETITEDTRLGADLVCPQGSPPAITIGAPNITLDLGGHTITGYPPATGVFAHNIEGLLIRNGTIDGFQDGIFIIGTRRVSMENLTVKNQSVFDPDHQISGIHIDGSHDVVVKRVLFEFPSVAHKEAVVIYESEVSVRDIEVRGGGAGVNFSFAQTCDPLQGPSNGEVVNSKFSEIYVAGILVACSSDARLADNDISTAPGVGVGIQGDAPFSGAVTGLTVEGNSIHDTEFGIEFRGIIESTVSNNLVRNNAGWGISMRQSLGCIASTPGWECFYSTSNVITDNQATGNGWTDLYHHENSTGNIWERNTCETKHGADIPECTITESAMKK